jgi:hypothetical protein
VQLQKNPKRERSIKKKLKIPQPCLPALTCNQKAYRSHRNSAWNTQRKLLCANSRCFFHTNFDSIKENIESFSFSPHVNLEAYASYYFQYISKATKRQQVKIYCVILLRPHEALRLIENSNGSPVLMQVLKVRHRLSTYNY